MDSSVHLQNIEIARKALEDLRNNLASDMSLDQLFQEVREGWKRCDAGANAEYFSDVEGYTEVNYEEYEKTVMRLLFLELDVKEYFEGEKTSAYVLANIYSRLDIPLTGRLIKEFREKDRQVAFRDGEIARLEDEVRSLQYRLGSNNRENPPSRAPRLAPPDTNPSDKENPEKAALFALQANISRQYIDDVVDSKKPGADLEEIRRRKKNPFRLFDFFGR